MKRYRIVLMVLSALTFSASLASAAFDIPGHVYRIDQLQQAREEANADDKQIVFLYSNEHTDCSLATRASINIMQRFKNNAVLVYICKEVWAKIPRVVREAIKSPEAGRFIPKTVVTDSGITEVVTIIPYERPSLQLGEACRYTQGRKQRKHSPNKRQQMLFSALQASHWSNRDPQFNQNLRDVVLKAVENQLVNNNPPETKQIYDRLLREGHSENDAKLLIANVVAAEIFEVVNRHEPFNHHVFARALNRLQKIPEA